MGLDPAWTATVDRGATDKRWDAYDQIILNEFDEYNRRLGASPGFVTLDANDFKKFKAMLWVESGGPDNPAWKSRPMQIGNPGDDGYPTLRDGKETAPVIMSDALKKQIHGNVSVPELNVRAGIAYTLVRLTKSDIESVDDPADTKVYEYVVKPGDSVDGIAKRVGSTTESFAKLNPGVNLARISPNNKLKYRKAEKKRVITGWLPRTTHNLAAVYNTRRGDANYEAKLDYVLKLLNKPKGKQ